MRLTKASVKLIQCERVARVATGGAAGVPHLVPVCQLLLGGKIYFASGKKGRKILNLRANPKLALTVDLYSDDWARIAGRDGAGHRAGD
jgi:nitroimidazol reductase NimA-like FMN-containing flavoprotein (pyridoxamine 5'-phosphate oxidase superfamily)